LALTRHTRDQAPRIHLLVCGQRRQRDGGVAACVLPRVKALLRERGDDDVRMVRLSELEMQHLLEVPRGALIVIADACDEAAPGEIVVRALDQLIDDPAGPSPHSAHGHPINHLLGVANCLAQAPLQGDFVGLGGADFEVGKKISPGVVDHLDEYAEAIVSRIEQLQRERGKIDTA
jgi:hydrogenase maturation protease